MVARLIAVTAGLAGAGLGAQAPGFTLQYMQNLNGRVAELKPIVEQFDADVARYGYSREAALAECETAVGLLDALCGGYATTLRRYEILTAHLADLKTAGVFARPLLVARGSAENPVIRDIARSTMDEFKPALPTTADGAAYAGGGFALLWGALSFLFGLAGAGRGRRYA